MAITILIVAYKVGMASERKYSRFDDTNTEDWLLGPDEEFIRIPMAGTYQVLTSTVSFENLMNGNVKAGQRIHFIVGLPPIGTPTFEIGGAVVKSRMTKVGDEPVHETMLTDEKNGLRLLLLLGIVINAKTARLMITGVQTR